MNSLLTVIQVYLPAICGIVPDDMVRAIRAFLDFCYIARRNIIDAHSLVELENALDRFRHYREVFVLAKVRPGGISLPPPARNLPLPFAYPQFCCSKRSLHVDNGIQAYCCRQAALQTVQQTQCIGSNSLNK